MPKEIVVRIEELRKSQAEENVEVFVMEAKESQEKAKKFEKQAGSSHDQPDQGATT